MSWFAELAGKAENLLNSMDEQTGAAFGPAKQKKWDRLVSGSSTAASPRHRPIAHNIKKLSPNSKYSPNRKSSPTAHLSPTREGTKGPIREKSPMKLYNLHHAPTTLVGDVPSGDLLMDHDYRERQFILKSDLRLVKDNFLFTLEDFDNENTKLRNELNVVNREVSELLSRLRKTEDDLKETSISLEDTNHNNQKLQANNKSLLSQLDKLKNEIDSLHLVETRNNCKIEELASEVAELKDRNRDLKDEINNLKEKNPEKDDAYLKLESDLCHALLAINALQTDLDKSNGECKRLKIDLDKSNGECERIQTDLDKSNGECKRLKIDLDKSNGECERIQTDLDKSNGECKRLEQGWETYKCRVKGKLSTKDNEIKALKERLMPSDDANTLVAQVDNLNELLSSAMAVDRGECDDLRQSLNELEERYQVSERMVLALRDALKDERAARNRVEAQCGVLSKKLKSMQIETGQTIASLRAALRDKEYELNHLKESTSSVQTPNTSALNVADYAASDVSVDTERVYQLTQKLVQMQGRVDSLLADNNMLRIMLEKLESKYKAEMQTLRGNSHSVVHFQDAADRNRVRSNQKEFLLATISRRMGGWIQRNPLFRIFIIIYMICLHLWVLAVLLTSTPENYPTNPSSH